MRKTVLVLASGVLPELNNVSGPITHPTRIDIKNLKMLVKNNRNVQECDPEDPWNESKRVPLTMDNLITDNFTNKKVETPVTPVEDTKVETPVTPVKDTKVETPVTPVKDTKVETPVTPVEDTKVETPVTPVEDTKVETPVTPVEDKKNKKTGKK
jgi:hypothetical protein